MIDNCCVKDGIINIASIKDVAAICSINHGYIINCSIESLSIEDDGGYIGGISSTNHKYILNCLVDSKINVRNKRKRASAICRQNNVAIENIYTYNYSEYNFLFENPTQEKTSINKPIFINKNYWKSNKSSENFIFHNDTSEDYAENVEQLNEWIDTEGKRKYPGITFRRWVYDGTSVPRLE